MSPWWSWSTACSIAASSSPASSRSRSPVSTSSISDSAWCSHRSTRSAVPARTYDTAPSRDRRGGRRGHRCELAITCAWRDKGVTSPVTIVPAGSGRAYLEHGLQRTRTDRQRELRAEAIVARLLAELATEPAYVRHRTCPRPAVAVSMSALVTRDEIDGVSARLERLGAQLPDVTIVVQGPWAPYTFAVSE